jgi:hypothetical protein
MARKAKARCPRCGKRMKPSDPYGQKCGHKNPLFAAAGRSGTAVKAAGAPPAPVYDLAGARYQQLMTAFKSAGGSALRDGYSAMLTEFATKGGDAA